MASDRARISFDPSRAYRAVVAQQGRVTLEADVNEAALIEGEALRLETIDIIGPAGTPAPPGDGYQVTPGTGPDEILIKKGVYYLGGWRLALEEDVPIGQQPDWLDRPAPSGSQSGNSVVSLLITEQSVCAVEDQALREVALGGPDTAARLRLMQHFLALPTTGSTCADGAAAVASLLAADGVTLGPYSDQLISSAALQVGFVPDTPPPDACSPAVAGGYLGADNQLVRVTVSAFNPQANTGEILWGWNNASILYRATLTDKLAGVLTLTGVPIDQEHAPQLGQAVEILRSRADLGDGNYIAADSGFVTTVTEAYSFDNGTLTIADIADLPPEYATDPNPLFVRLWQAIVPFTAGQAVALDTVSGLMVTVTLAALPAQIAARPFWRFAVRPNTPANVYPARYQEGPQPPDGPRQWLCDLAVVGDVGDSYGLLQDCRPTFTALTDQTPGGCCGLTLDPAGVAARGGLQSVVNSMGGGPAVLSLKPGIYTLEAPLILTPAVNGFVLEGCAPGVIFRSDPANLAEFAFGLIILDAVIDVTIRGLDIVVPLVGGAPGAAGVAGGTVVGVLAVNTTLAVVEDCIFSVSTATVGAFGGAVTVIGFARNLSVRRCIFTGPSLVGGALVCGVMAAVNNQAVTTLLDDVDINDNQFQSLNTGVFVYARLGEVRCAANRVRGCVTGLLFADSMIGAAGEFAKTAMSTDQAVGGLAYTMQRAFKAPALAMSAQSNASFFTRVDQTTTHVSSMANDVLREDIIARGAAIFAEISAHHMAAAMGTAATESVGVQAQTVDNTYVSAVDQVNSVSIMAEATEFGPVAATLHIENNDIVLADAGEIEGAGVGVSIVMSPRDEEGMVLLSGNRVVCADTSTPAVSVLLSEFLTVNGNMLLQPPSNPTTGNVPALIIYTLKSALNAITGNVVRSGALIVPPRTAPAPSPDWTFLNTVS
jgi:hypothetical protein